MNVSMVVRLFVVVFIIVIFVWLSSFCALPHLNINKIAPNRITAAEAFISSYSVAQEVSPKD